MRWAQLAFTDDDPGNFDPQFWLDYFKRIHADGACLSAGGFTAYYPTKIALHTRAPGVDQIDAERLEAHQIVGVHVFDAEVFHALGKRDDHCAGTASRLMGGEEAPFGNSGADIFLIKPVNRHRIKVLLEELLSPESHA